MEGQGQRLWGLSARFHLVLLTQLPLLLQQLHGCFSFMFSVGRWPELMYFFF